MTRYVLCVSFLACARAPLFLDQQLEFADHNIRLKHVFSSTIQLPGHFKTNIEKIWKNPQQPCIYYWGIQKIKILYDAVGANHDDGDPGGGRVSPARSWIYFCGHFCRFTHPTVGSSGTWMIPSLVNKNIKRPTSKRIQRHNTQAKLTISSLSTCAHLKKNLLVLNRFYQSGATRCLRGWGGSWLLASCRIRCGVSWGRRKMNFDMYFVKPTS